MKTARTLALLALSLPLVGCASVAATSDAKAPSDEQGGASEQRKEERAVEYAKLEYELAGMRAEAAERSEKQAVAKAAEELERKAAALANFREVAGPLERAERALSLRRAEQRLLESEQEIAELESMYAQEDFAETTKELVLTRGRAQVEMARTGLDLARREMQQLEAYEHPRRERELVREVEEAEAAKARAEADLARGNVQRHLDLLKAKHAVEDATEALEG